MFVTVNHKGRVYYDAEQGINIDDKRTYEVKATPLIRELLKQKDISEAKEPSKEVLAKYAAEDKEIAERKNKAVKPTVKKPLEEQLKDAVKNITELTKKLGEAEAKITELENLSTGGDPKTKITDALKDAKAAATDPKKETTVAKDKENL